MAVLWKKYWLLAEFAKRCMASAAILSIHLICASSIYKYGNEYQKQKFLPKLTNKGRIFGSFCFDEPNAGSDAGSAKTTAILDQKQMSMY